MRSARAKSVDGIVAGSKILFASVVLGFICILGWGCGLYVAPDVYQRIRLAALERGFGKISHPSGTALVERKSDYLPYAANRCAYFVGELRAFDGERQEIVDFYTHQTRKDPFSGDLYILFVNDEGLAERSIPLRGESEHSWASRPIVRPDDPGLSGLPPFPPDLEGRLYLVFLAHKGDFYIDYRCH